MRKSLQTSTDEMLYYKWRKEIKVVRKQWEFDKKNNKKNVLHKKR